MELSPIKKMALTESTLRKKEEKILLKDKKLREKIDDIKGNKTIKKNIPIYFDPEMKKTKRKMK